MALSVGASAAIAACSSDPQGLQLPDGSEAMIVDEVVELAASPAAVWGDGRAVRALPVDDSVTAVVTTTGVHLVEASGEPVDLDLFGRATQVGQAAVSDDGSTLAVVTLAPPIVRWYDLNDRRFVGADELELGTDVTDLGFLPGSTDLVAVTTTGIAAWPTGPVGGLSEPLGDPTSIGQSTFLADGRIAVPMLETGELAVVSSDAIERVPIALPEGAAILGARSSPDGATLAVAYWNGSSSANGGDSIAVLDSISYERLGTIDVAGPVRPDGWTVTDARVAVADGATITMWTHAGDPLGTTEAPTDQTIVSVHAWNDGLVSIHHAGAIASWSAETAEPARLLSSGGITVDSVIDAERNRLISVDFYGRITSRGLIGNDPPVDDDRFATGQATSVSISGDGGSVAVASTNGKVAVLRPDLTETSSFSAGDGPVLVDEVAFNPDTGQLATGLAERVSEFAFDDTVTTWDPGDQVVVHALGGEREDVAGCAFFYSRVTFTDDGSMMAITSHDYSVLLVDVSNGELIYRFDPGPSTVLDIAFTADDEMLVATTDTGSVTVWNVADRSVAEAYQSELGGYRAIAMLPNDDVMATVDASGTLRLLDVLTGANVLTFDGVSAPTTEIALSADGALLAAPADDSTVGVWSTDSGLRLATLIGHAATVTDLAFSPDGAWLVTASDDGTVRRWILEATR